MSKRLSRVLVVLVVLAGLSAGPAVAGPTNTYRVLRASACCKSVCHHAASVGAASHCCGVRTSSEDSANFTLTKVSLTAPSVASHSVELIPVGLHAQVKPVIERAHARAAPVFLLTRSLRI
jgi:hypothetical protein